MKVTFISHMFPNPAQPFKAPFMLERARALAKVVKLRVISPASYFPVLRTKCPAFVERKSGLNIYHPKYLGLPSQLWVLRWISYYLSVLKNERKMGFYDCNIIHTEWIYPDAYAVALLARDRGIKTIGVVHGNEAIGYFEPLKHRVKYRIALQKLDHIIAVSTDLMDKMINEYSVESTKISVILNGVDSNKFRPIDKKVARQKIDVPIEEPIGVCVARLSEEKNLHILIETVFQLKDAAPLIYLIGDGPLRKKLEALVERLEMEDKIKLVGAVPHNDVATWLNAADFFYLPSQREGCPVVVHESLACGVPVIATAVGAIPDLIRDDRYGLLCEPDNVDAFADIMKKAMSMKWDRNVISSYGRQFTWDKMARETVKIYKSILK